MGKGAKLFEAIGATLSISTSILQHILHRIYQNIYSPICLQSDGPFCDYGHLVRNVQLRVACRDRQLADSFEVGGVENVPGIPGACATRIFSYLVRGPMDCPRKGLLIRNMVPSYDVILFESWQGILVLLICISISRIPRTFGECQILYWLSLHFKNQYLLLPW